MKSMKSEVESRERGATGIAHLAHGPRLARPLRPSPVLEDN